METFKHRFAGRVLAEGDIYLGARGDRGVRKLVFALPEIATDQLAYLKLDFSLPLKAPLVREAEGWAWTVEAGATQEAGLFGAQVEIFDGETMVWNSDIFHAIVSESLHVNAEIEPVMLPELLEAEAALQAAIAKTDDILDAVDQEEARETAEAARVTAEQGRVTAEQGRVAAEEAREEAFNQFEQNLAGGEYNGATFTPAVSAAGVISWTNDKGLANPASVNITGPQGEPGAKGDTGATGPQGPQGPQGATGPTGPQGPQGTTGPQGPQGPAGADGAPGAKGDKGDKGDTGDSGVYLGSTEPADESVKVWINPLGNPTPEVDDTLSISGAPADAAATGQAIEAVSPDDESVGAKPWSSLQIIDTLCPPLEVAGNPAVCYPVANYPLGVKASWEPRQEGSGDPSPENVRPIVGLDSVKVTRCGKNLLPYTKPSNPVYSSNGITYTWHDDGSIHVAGTSTARADSNVMNFSGFYLPPGNYVFGSTGISGLSLHLVVQKASTGSNTWYSGNVSIEPGDVPQYFYISCQSGITIDTTIYAFLTYGDNTLTANDYAPYTGTTATLTLPETIYGGTVDAVTGVGSENWRYRELDGTEGGSLGNIDVSDTIQQFNLSIIDPQTDAKLPCMCNMLPQTVDAISGNVLGIYHHSQSTFVFGFPRAPLREYGFIDGNTETYMTAFKAYLAAQFAAGTPVTIAYKLATPTTFQATGGQSLPALPGTNTIYTDADSVTVTGRADPVQAINALNDRIAALEDAATGG